MFSEQWEVEAQAYVWLCVTVQRICWQWMMS